MREKSSRLRIPKRPAGVVVKACPAVGDPVLQLENAFAMVFERYAEAFAKLAKH